jgi:tetratricopeptide (TPR) repeat protein
MPDATALPVRRSLWILGPSQDLIWFILTPLFVVPIVLGLKQRVPVETLGALILGFGGFGHHLPGFIRAYSDPALFQRHKARFTIIPLLLLAASAAFSYLNLNAMACATVLWGTWHGAMQVNGFARIYDAKADSTSPLTARLDWLMCLAWFGLAILHSPSRLFSIVAQFYASGGFLIPPPAFGTFRVLWDTATVAITVLFAMNAFRRWKSGNPPSPIKFLTMAASFAFWWYCVVTVNDLILGLILWELFHDVQYNTLVWMFQRQRVERHLGVSVVEKALFGPGTGRLAVYGLLILAYGYIGVKASFASVNLPEKLLTQPSASLWLLRIIIVSAILHFYYDGFIWKIRESSIRKGLGFQEAKTAVPEPARLQRSWRHAWKWSFFAVPVALLGYSQYHDGMAPPPSLASNLSEAIPQSWLAHFTAGTYYQESGFMDKARTEYEATLRYNPDYALGHMSLAEILYNEGDATGALNHFQRSVELDPASVQGRRNLAYLLIKSGRFTEAEEQFKAALKLDPANPELLFGTATALHRQGKFGDAEIYLKKTLELSPQHSGVLNNLGVIREAQGDTSGAIVYYKRALQADANNADARRNIAKFEATRNTMDSAGIRQQRGN